MKSKLAYLCSSQSWGGLEMNHIRNAHWMKELGYDVVAICIANSPIEKYAIELNVPIHHIEPHKKYYDFKKGRELARYLSSNGYSHLIIRSTYDMSITATVKRILRNKIHTSYFMEMQLGVKKTNLLHTLRFKHVDLWSCPLNWLQHQVKTMTHFKNECVVIPSGLDLSQFNSTISKESARELLNLPQKSMLFGLIGRFDPQKGQMLLLEAMEKAKDQQFEVVLLGEPTKNEGEAYFSEMHQKIENAHLSNRVHIRPFMKDVSIFFTAVDWFVMATKAETFGMVTIESLANGTPVLGSNAGGTPEILDHLKGGRLFTTLDATSLANEIDRIIADNFIPDSNELKKMATAYDHRTVCQLVEKHLHLSK